MTTLEILDKSYKDFKKYWYPIMIVIFLMSFTFLIITYFFTYTLKAGFIAGILSFVFSAFQLGVILYLIDQLLANNNFDYMSAFKMSISKFKELALMYLIVLGGRIIGLSVVTVGFSLVGIIMVIGVVLGIIYLFSVPFMVILDNLTFKDALTLAPEKNKPYFNLIFKTQIASFLITGSLYGLVTFIFNSLLNESFIGSALLLFFVIPISIYQYIVFYNLFQEIKLDRTIFDLIDDQFEEE